MKDIQVSVTSGPTIFNADNFDVTKYLSIGVKYNPGISPNKISPDLMEELLVRIKNEILKLSEQRFESVGDQIMDNEEDTGIISLTDKFFEYLKNNDTKIQAIRVSLNDYDNDHREQKLRTLKTKMMVITVDKQSMDDTFDTVVKELFYEFGDTVIDLYSVILTPKMYKIINNVPVEYRGILIRVKK